MKRVALYVRVSTSGQTVKTQIKDLRTAAKRHGWNIVATFNDEGISGAKGRDQRPGLDDLLKAVTRRDVDLVAAWSVDRLGRSLTHLVAILEEIRAKGVGLYLHQQGLDTTTPAGRAMFGMLSVFAEFERAIIVERVKAGMDRAKAEQAAGKRRVGNDGRVRKNIGRPRSLTPQRIRAIKRLRDRGLSLRQLAIKTGLGVATVDRAIKAA